MSDNWSKIRRFTENSYFHVIDEVARPDRDRTGSWFNRQYILWLPQRRYRHPKFGNQNLDRKLYAQVVLRPELGIGFIIERHAGGDEADLSGSVLLPFMSLYWHIDGYPELCVKGYDSREIELKAGLYDGDLRLRWHLYKDPHAWSSTDGWRRGSFQLLNKLFGWKKRVGTRLIEERAVMIHMPEGGYEGSGKLEEWEYKRKRWPFRQHRLHVEIAVPRGVPIPGKGENSWDLDEDATFALSCSASSIEDGIGQVVASVLRRREQYGGGNWLPGAVR